MSILETLSCPNCGAAVEVPENQNKATCGYCQSNFTIKSDTRETSLNFENKSSQGGASQTPLQQHDKAIEALNKLAGATQTVRSTQTAPNQNSGSCAGALAVPFVIILFIGGIVGFSIYMSVSQKNKVQDRIEATRLKHKREARQRKRKAEQRKWDRFLTSYSSKLTKKDLKALNEVKKALKLPIYGKKDAKYTIIVLHTYRVSNSYLKKLNRFQKTMLEDHKDLVNFIFIPLPRKRKKRYREVEFLLEAKLQQGNKMFRKVHKKLMRANASDMYYMKFYKKLAKYSGLDKKQMTNALKKHVHKDKIELLDKLIFALDLERYYPNLIIGKRIYKGSTVMSRLELLTRHTLGVEYK